MKNEGMRVPSAASQGVISMLRKNRPVEPVDRQQAPLITRVCTIYPCVESRKVVPICFWQSLVKSYRTGYDLLQEDDMLAGRRSYAPARTKDDVSNTPADQRTSGLWFK